MVEGRRHAKLGSWMKHNSFLTITVAIIIIISASVSWAQYLQDDTKRSDEPCTCNELHYKRQQSLGDLKFSNGQYTCLAFGLETKIISTFQFYLLSKGPQEDFIDKTGNQCLTPRHAEMQEIKIQQLQIQFI